MRGQRRSRRKSRSLTGTSRRGLTTRARSALVLARSGRSASIGSFTPSSWESGGSYRDPPLSQTDARSISGMGPTIPGPGSKTTAESGLARPTLSKRLDLR